jgi:hypothetical protein
LSAASSSVILYLLTTTTKYVRHLLGGVKTEKL